MTIGDKVRKAPRRGEIPGAVMGTVVELTIREGKEWVRIAAGKAQTTTSLWPVKLLEVVA
jgi:hypothetical protein